MASQMARTAASNCQQVYAARDWGNTLRFSFWFCFLNRYGTFSDKFLQPEMRGGIIWFAWAIKQRRICVCYAGKLHDTDNNKQAEQGRTWDMFKTQKCQRHISKCFVSQKSSLQATTYERKSQNARPCQKFTCDLTWICYFYNSLCLGYMRWFQIQGQI